MTYFSDKQTWHVAPDMYRLVTSIDIPSKRKKNHLSLFKYCLKWFWLLHYHDLFNIFSYFFMFVSMILLAHTCMCVCVHIRVSTFRLRKTILQTISTLIMSCIKRIIFCSIKEVWGYHINYGSFDSAVIHEIAHMKIVVNPIWIMVDYQFVTFGMMYRL